MSDTNFFVPYLFSDATGSNFTFASFMKMAAPVSFPDFNLVPDTVLPDLTANGLSFYSTNVTFKINNVGTDVAAASSAGIYLSTDHAITTADTLLNTYSTPSLAASATDTESALLNLPTNLAVGVYYVGVIADYNNTITESNESNNASSGSAIKLGNDSANTINGTLGTVYALGGDDTINLGASLKQSDRIDGGTGNDTVTLNGDYSAGVTIGPSTMVNVEAIILQGTYTYKLAINGDNTVAAGQTLDVSSAGNAVMNFSVQGETNGYFNITGGNYDDTFNMGASMNATDVISGSFGNDTLILNGDYSSGLSLANVTHIETIKLTGGHSYTLSNLSRDVSLVDGSALKVGDVLNFDGSTSIVATIRGGSGNDIIAGSEFNTPITIYGNAGNDTLNLNNSKTTFYGGTGNDTVNAGGSFYTTDHIDGGNGFDKVIFAANYTYHQTWAANTFSSVEELYFSNPFSYNITMDDGNVAAGHTMLIDASHLKGAHTLTLDCSAETSGSFIFRSGSGSINGLGDSLASGGGADTFIYTSVNQSNSSSYDTIGSFNFAADKFDFTFTVTAVDAAVTTGMLDSSTFDSDLATAMSGHLGAHHAILFTPDTGGLEGQTFLIVDANNTAGYQAGADFVIHLTNATGTMTTSDFI